MNRYVVPQLLWGRFPQLRLYLTVYGKGAHRNIASSLAYLTWLAIMSAFRGWYTRIMRMS